jgi:amidase
MSVTSLDVKSGASLPVSELDRISSLIGLEIPSEQKADYLRLLSSFESSIQSICDLPDYFPVPNTEKFPRKDSHEVSEKENSLGAWAHKVTISGATTGLLTGKTICLKDNIAVAEVPCKNGTNVFTDWCPQMDATVVTRVLEAGGTIVGKATCENLCMSSTSFSAASGPVQNPFAFGFSAGGSSSGCGALVGSKEVDIGIGADQVRKLRDTLHHSC